MGLFYQGGRGGFSRKKIKLGIFLLFLAAAAISGLLSSRKSAKFAKPAQNSEAREAPAEAESSSPSREISGDDYKIVKNGGETVLIHEKEAPFVNAPGLSGLIDVNTASYEELLDVKGIGHATAQKIIGARPFAKLEDIAALPGIGQRQFDKIKIFLKIGNEAKSDK